ncbi:hypothetical protein I302_106197 [Kwoniella bestiolae CBS 10118]|uniref:Uncharacterized protein n=1 Tax=Kwoniella bestiolae CBS 10118 TaxID=1296100 RepID=A0A1B9G3B8_9TREE|nr:hypothetical protein I302_05320 [Kwoniella bestiolae CBS 10118]OCF25500.1 hypothetical protein I302_05320 [Kwoniella bestiolae CBS 10118]
MPSTSKFLLLLTVLALCIAVVHATPIKLPTRTNGNHQVNNKVTRNDRLSNAERIARGLPLKSPKWLYDPTKTHVHEARASGLNRRRANDDEAYIP